LLATRPLHYTSPLNEYLCTFSLSCKTLLFIICTFLCHYTHSRTPHLPSFSHFPRPPPSLHSWNSDLYIFNPTVTTPSLYDYLSSHPFYLYMVGYTRKLIWPFHVYTVCYTLDLGLVSHVNWCRECFNDCACSKLKWRVRVVCASGVCYREARFQCVQPLPVTVRVRSRSNPIAAGSRWYATEPFLCTSV